MNKVPLHPQAIISAVFIALILVFWWSFDRYWQNTLQPRLYLAAETQAKILAESQAARLVAVLNESESDSLKSSLVAVVQSMLIVEDPAIGERFIKKVTLEFDYSVIPVKANSLDLSFGEDQCPDCFTADIPLIKQEGELSGLAIFSISDGYFRILSQEMKSKLFAESSIAFGLLISAWLLMIVMFSRLHKAKQMVEASDHAKTRFMANVTHELRTPLNAILGYTQLYKQDKEIMEHYGQGVDAIDRNAEHLLLMISDILEFSRANEDNLTLFPTEVKLVNFLNTLVEMIQISTQIKSLTFEYQFDNDLPEIVLVDEKRLRQIMLNLLNNAVKFTDKGKVSLFVRLISCKEENARIQFCVEDSGIGIDQSNLHSIFIPFQQLDNPITRAEGSGLGLTISQRLVKLMGASLQVNSKTDTGSRFWFELSLPFLSNLKTIAQTDIQHATHVNDKQDMVLPNDQQISTLVEQIKRHNIIGIRSELSKLSEQAELETFLKSIKPYVDNYRFKQLLEWINKLSNK